MDFKRCSSESDFSNVGQTIHRPVCITSKSQDGIALHMGSPCNSSSNRCSNNIMGHDVRVCFRTNMPRSENVGTHVTVSVPSYSNCFTMAETALVHKMTTNECCTTNTSAMPFRSSETTQNCNLSSEPRSVQSE